MTHTYKMIMNLLHFSFLCIQVVAALQLQANQTNKTKTLQLRAWRKQALTEQLRAYFKSQEGVKLSILFRILKRDPKERYQYTKPSDIFNLRKFLESLSNLRSPQKSGEFLANSPKSLQTNSEIFHGEPLQKLSIKNRVFYISWKLTIWPKKLPKNYFKI